MDSGLKARTTEKSFEEEEDDFMAELEDDDAILGAFRERRLQEYQLQVKKVEEMMERKHGEYTETLLEKDLMKLTISSPFVVVHFYQKGFRRCEIMDKHLTTLAKRHFDTKFTKISVEKAPFLVEKLKIQVLPCVISFVNGISADRLIGFEELGNVDDFKTEVLEKRLQSAAVIAAPNFKLARK